MGEVVPGGAVVAVVLADRAPRPLGQVRSPRTPGRIAGVRLHEPGPLGAHRHLTHSPYSSRAVLGRRKPPVPVVSVTLPRRLSAVPPDSSCVHVRNRGLRAARCRRGAGMACAGRARRLCDGDRQRPAHAPLPRVTSRRWRRPNRTHDGARITRPRAHAAGRRQGTAGDPRVVLGCGRPVGTRAAGELHVAGRASVLAVASG
jgi:hypothetical protein